MIKEKASVRVSGTGLFFTPEATTIPAVLKQLLRRFHVLPQRTIFLHIRIVDVPFVLPTYPYSTALDIEDLGDGLYFARTTYGYASGKIAADKIADDIVSLVDRLEIEKRKKATISTLFEVQKKQEDDNEAMSTVTYIVGRDSVVAKEGSNRLRRLLVKSYNFLAQNSRDFASFYHIPPNDLIELGYRFSA